MKTRLPVLIALVVLPLRSFAADLPVSYLVEEKPLKAAIAGTPLTFELYSDNGCTDLVATSTVAIESVSLAARIKPFNPKNATKRPNLAEVRRTLSGVTAYGNMFLKVVGTGITPSGGSCQPQGARAGQAVVIDNTGKVVGLDGGSTVISDGPRVIVSDGVASGNASLNVATISTVCGPSYLATQFLNVYFASSDCSGTPYVELYVYGASIGNTVYVPNGPAVSFPYNSRRGPNTPSCACQATSGTATLAPAAPIDLDGFTPPFRTELR